MKKITFILSIMLIGFAITAARAQKIAVTAGDISSFKGIGELNVEYDFSDFGVGKFKTEQEYIDKKKKEYNDDEAGKGDAWEENWHADKENTYQPKFEELFNIVMLSKGTGIEAGTYPDAEFTLVLKTTFLEPGFNVGISSKNASIDVIAYLVRTGDESNHLVDITMTKVPGNGLFFGEYDAEGRIAQAYATAGEKLAAYICKKGF